MTMLKFSMRLIVAMVFVQLGLHSVLRAEPTAVTLPAADQAWQNLQHDYQTPPAPLKQLPNRMYTQQEIRDYYAKVASRAGEVADEAKAFYTQYPNNPNTAKAQDIYFDMLQAAVALSNTAKIDELEAATAERLKDPKLDDDGRFQLSLRVLRSVVSGRQYEGDDAMRGELEKRARQLAHDYPNHPDGYNYLLNLARAADPKKCATLAREVLAGSHDAKTRAESQFLINRSLAVGKPLQLTLALSDGKKMDLQQQQGKVVILLFWDSASQYSPKALWAVNELYKTYHAKGVEVLGLNFDSDRSAEAATLKDVGVKWPQYMDIPAGRMVENRFGADTLPMCWMVDKKGVLRELHAERDPEGILKKLLME